MDGTTLISRRHTIKYDNVINQGWKISYREFKLGVSNYCLLCIEKIRKDKLEGKMPMKKRKWRFK